MKGKKVAEEDEESEFDLTVSEIQLRKKGSGEIWLGPACAPHVGGLLRSSWLMTSGRLAVMRV